MLMTVGLYIATFLLCFSVLGMLHKILFKNCKVEERVAAFIMVILEVFALNYLFNQIFG